jgi:cell division protein FtsL
MSRVLRIFVCIVAVGITLYFYIDKQNEIVELRIAIPALAKEVKALHEENNRLQYQIDRFESPEHLMELARKPEFTHLKFPKGEEVIVLPEPPPLSFEGGKKP